MRSAFRIRDYRLIVSASTISQTGDWLYNVALIVWAYQVTHSTAWVAGVTIARLVPYPVFGALGGVVADRYDRRRVLVVSDLARVLAMTALALVAAGGGPVALAAGLAALTSMLGTAYRPAVVGMLPDVVGEEQLVAANAMESLVENLSIVVGPLIGAALLLVASPALAFAANAVTFVVSALCAAAIRTRSHGDAAEPRGDEGWARHVVRGFDELRRSADARVLTGFLVGTSFVYGAQTVILVLVAGELLSGGTDSVGIFYAAMGLGGIVGAAAVTRLGRSPRAGLTLLVGLAVTAVPIAVLGLVTGASVAAVLVLASGTGMVVVDVLCLTQLQRTVPGEVLGRVWGAVDALTVLAMIVGSLLVGPCVDAIGTDAAFAVLMFAVPTLGLLATRRLLHADREAVTLLERIGPLIELLETVPLFEQASRPVLEQLALVSVREELPIGADAVVQGDPAEHFFVIEAGRFDVYRADAEGTERVGLLARGDWFGEVGLINHTPRNATVTARWPSTVWRIDGAQLLAAVNGAPALSARLVEGVSTRLATQGSD
jgi:MFS family permease